jgi:hypothetical protein
VIVKARVFAKRGSNQVYNTIPKSRECLMVNYVINARGNCLLGFNIFRGEQIMDDCSKLWKKTYLCQPWPLVLGNQEKIENLKRRSRLDLPSPFIPRILWTLWTSQFVEFSKFKLTQRANALSPPMFFFSFLLSLSSPLIIFFPFPFLFLFSFSSSSFSYNSCCYC